MSCNEMCNGLSLTQLNHSVNMYRSKNSIQSNLVPGLELTTEFEINFSTLFLSVTIIFNVKFN